MHAFTIAGASGDTDATLYEPAAPRHTLILAHGAGAGQRHPWMRARAADLVDRHVRVITFDFPYMMARRKVPDRSDVLIASWRAVVDDVARRFPAQPLTIGGKSMGGRMATMLVAEPDAPPEVRGCVALGYPLHPPGKPEQRRVAHLGAIRVPLLVIQGGRDPFGAPDDVERACREAGLAATVVGIAQGGHGFEVRARDARQAEEYARVADTVARWLDTLQPADS